ncbi:MAG: ATP-dependent helicase [Coriobacteriales bacterium]|nr:ATP-dependent helicase [Coriobacteriales bacterium]MBQ6585767.1 ATP-dependent helicase [Coriobacteriales bacterium]
MSWDEGIDGIVKEAVARDTAKVKIVGGPGTGKTFVLQRRVQRLLESGVYPKDIAVFVTSPSAAEVFALDLQASGVPGADKVIVTTPHDYFVRILSTPEAIAATGRVPRIISEADYKFLAEDLKVLGTRPKRLKEMLKYFYKQLSEMGDDKDDFIVVNEERFTLDTLRKHLVARNAMLEEELSNIAVHYLRDTDGVRERLAIKHVLVDDYQNISRASQMACRLLSGVSFTIAGNESETVYDGAEPFPYPQGIGEFLTKNEFVLEHSMRLPQRVASGCNSLAMLEPFKDAHMVGFTESDPLGDVQVVRWENSDAEFAGICKYLTKRFNDEEDPLIPQDVLLIVPNRIWGKNIIKRFAQKRIKTSAILSKQPLSGNPKDIDKCASMRAFTALNLVADPYDAVAWRAWVGYGDYLLRSGAWCRLEEYAEQNGIGVVDALDAISKMPAPIFLESDALGEAYKQGVALIDKCAGKVGFTLLNTLAATVLGRGSEFPRDIEELFAPVIGDEDAKTLFARAFPQTICPKFTYAHNVLRVGYYPAMRGLSAKVVVLIGTINGFVPVRDVFDNEIAYNVQDKIRDETRMVFYSAVSRTCDKLIISYFQKEVIEVAEPLKMHIHRIRAEKGQRMVMLAPSLYIDEMGGSIPGPIDGAHLK